jgi:folate-binding protein YgfZ
MYYTSLTSRGLLALSGDDTIPFLQGLVTNNVGSLSEGKMVYAALLSPQGKYLHDFFLMAWEDKILLDGERLRLPDLMQRLKLYRLRSKVTIEPMPDNWGVVAAWGEQQAVAGFADPRLPGLGYRLVGDRVATEARCAQQGWQHVDEVAYDRMRLELGVPDGSRDFTIDRSVLMHYGFEDLNGVDFKKGCYVGQEIMARTKYRGQVRKFLYQVQAINTVCPPPGTPIYLGDTQVGELHSSEGDIGLATLRVEEVDKAEATQTLLRAGDVSLRVFLPFWVKQRPLLAAGE